MSKLQPVRGTHDILPEDMRRHRAVADGARDVAALYGYEEVATPIFEFTEVFKRTLGDTSDIVTKEMYTFEMNEGESLTLRPENTAGVARAFISQGLAQQVPLKYFYAGPMFRYERPQKGRQRQFHQIGVELLGVPGAMGDVEVIALGAQILARLGIAEATKLEINSLGDPESRLAYRAALVSYFTAHKAKISKESLERLDRNPLRILDSKDEGDRVIVADAPLFEDFLNPASKDFFAKVCEGLTALGLSFEVNPRLVRGLDYYTHTAFEFTTDRLGAQSAVMAGGRYDGLIETMGGPATPGVGWAAGIERLAMLLAATPALARPISVVPVSDAEAERALILAGELRAQGLHVDLAYDGPMRKRMKRANKIASRFAVLLGAEELAADEVTLKDLDQGSQERVPLASLAAALAARLAATKSVVGA